jgi:peptidoglycan/LPS O-acetylase OafA/YrhL
MKPDWLKNNNRMLISLALCLILFFALVSVVETVLPGARKIQVTVQFDHADTLQIFYGNGLGKGEFTEKNALVSQPVQQYQVKKIRFAPNNVPVRNLRLDLGETPGIARILKITISSFFAQRVDLTPEAIQQLFSVHPAETLTVLENNYLQFRTDRDTYLVSRVPLLRLGWFLHYGLPLIFACLCFIVLQQVRFSRFPAFADIYDKRPSTGENVNALDGLRGIAVLMVIAEHTWARFSGLGISGVWIFMTLSGFLLARPFVLHPERILSLEFWRFFFLRRVQRIVPVYYLYIIIVFLISGYYDDAIRHFLFIQGSGHLWVVPQEMLFYLITPGLMLCNILIFRGKPMVILVNILALTALANHYLTIDVFFLYGMNNIKMRAYVGVFFSGILASYFYYGIWTGLPPAIRDNTKTRTFFAILTILLLAFFFLCANARLWGGYENFSWFGAGAALLILAILGAGRSAVISFLSWIPLRAISVVSFSIYIFHTLVIGTVGKITAYYFQDPISEPILFLWTLGLSYLLACFTYTFIERPFIRN